MKNLITLLLFLLAPAAASANDGFKASLPTSAMARGLTADMFKNSDAVILLKQQGYAEGPHPRKGPFTVTYMQEYVVTSQVIIAKVFNEAGVKHFGSFEYEYPSFDGIRQSFRVRARVMKPDSTILVLPDEAITTIAGLTTESGRPVTQKVLFTLGNLAPGDVVQIEYDHTQPFLYLRKVLFYYHDRYPILNSTLTINMDARENVDFLSFPRDKVGEPEVTQRGRTISHFWAVKNLSEIPNEPFSRPFADVSYITAVVNHPPGSDENRWRSLAQEYLRDYIDKGSLPTAFMKQIGLDPALHNPRWTDIEQAYTALRKFFSLKASNSLFPDAGNIDKVINAREGDASDLAYMTLKIMKRWKVPATPVLIRDKRDGVYETTVPSFFWFDRLAVLVSLEGAERVIDFDRSIPSRFHTPWFLNGITVTALYDTGVAHMYLSSRSSLQDHTSKEFHCVNVVSDTTAVDSVSFRLRGARGDDQRSRWYASKGAELAGAEHAFVKEYVLREVDTSWVNDFLNEPEVALSGKGASRGRLRDVDSFVTFRPRNHLLREFRDRFTDDERSDDIWLEEPFACSLRWIVRAAGRSIASAMPAPVAFEDSALASSQTTYFRSNDSTFVIIADVAFASARVARTRYREFLLFLDRVIDSCEGEVAFKRR